MALLVCQEPLAYLGWPNEIRVIGAQGIVVIFVDTTDVLSKVGIFGGQFRFVVVTVT